MSQHTINADNTNFVLSWLDQVASTSSFRSAKRRRPLEEVPSSRLNYHGKAIMSSEKQPLPRRRSPRRKDEADTTPNTAPQPSSLTSRPIPILSPPSLPSESQSATTQSVSPTRTLRGRQATQSGSTIATSTSSPSRRRFKDMVALELANRPVQYRRLGLNSKDLPDALGVRQLYSSIQRANIVPRGLLPLQFKDIFCDSFGDLIDVYPDIFVDHTHYAPYFAESELHQVLDITQEAVALDGSGASEATWNSDVHSRVLKLGLDAYRQLIPSHGIQSRNITTAHIDTTLRLSRGEADSFPDKLVDFALIVSIPDSIYRAVLREDPILQSLNQSTYGPICLKPIGVGIETKTKTGTDDRQQLTLWTAAWFERQRLLADTAKEQELADEQPQPDGMLDSPADESVAEPTQKKKLGLTYPTVVPLLSIRGHDWSLLFMEDHGIGGGDGYSYTLYEGPIIGDTKTPLGCYKILKALVRLCEWLDEHFRPSMVQFYRECCLAKGVEVGG
ncbi:hypothetical protein QQZ08_010981 [Neonectria magnoliae]|uniref:PD-(D/E)XK nuclease-like domain-containing protein n=1 Tax=Neonectria magnoliae TaxID=2732573 RepID=A0ABR1HDE9_9HYPO